MTLFSETHWKILINDKCWLTGGLFGQRYRFHLIMFLKMFKQKLDTVAFSVYPGTHGQQGQRRRFKHHVLVLPLLSTPHPLLSTVQSLNVNIETVHESWLGRQKVKLASPLNNGWRMTEGHVRCCGETKEDRVKEHKRNQKGWVSFPERWIFSC